MTPRVAYSLFMFLRLDVFVLTRWLLPRPAPLAALPWWKRFALAWAVLVGGAIGAKLPFVLDRQRVYLPEPVGPLGLTFYQWVAIVLTFAMAIQWWIDERLLKRELFAAAV